MSFPVFNSPVSRKPFLCPHPPPLALTIHPLFCDWFWALRGRCTIQRPHLGLSLLQFLIVDYYTGNSSEEAWEMHWYIDRAIRKSVGVSLIVCPVSRATVACYILGLRPVDAQVLGANNSARCGLLESNQKGVGYYHNICAVVVPVGAVQWLAVILAQGAAG